ncbi:hypothetical protein BIV60_14390 [Bacillus sp. MUM 116]|uniref:YndM family protein n=1 Tax=Bacillus sp. MUM 116 TaxID=1678002 RepID=UPI0008F59960|nr:YndM family protein [Bacillus sp. MUM 116]OIK13273.1 hypothetical protein BIV60_14390 [Bacillus sp. MUM 116]
MTIIVKFVTCLVAYAVALDLFFDATWVDIVWFSVMMTIVSYLGDRILLSKIGNKNTLIADFILAYMVVWIFGSVLLDNYMQIAWGSLISAIIITAGEYFVHRLLHRSIPEDSNKRNAIPDRLAYGMEMSEEHEPLKKK